MNKLQYALDAVVDLTRCLVLVALLTSLKIVQQLFYFALFSFVYKIALGNDFPRESFDVR